MAISLPALLEGIQIAWDIITSTYEPLNAGETFTALPFAYVEGVYQYTNKQDVVFKNQPAYLKYEDGEFFIFGSGEGSFTVSASEGEFKVSHSGSGSTLRVAFAMQGVDKFRIDRSASFYDYTFAELDAVYILGYSSNNLVNHKYNSKLFTTFSCFSLSGTSIGNVTEGSWSSLIENSVPIYPGYSYTYYEALDTYINYFNDKYSDLDLNLTTDDFPSESDYLPEVPTTEPVSGGCCNIDYGEIMSPSEFDDVLNSAEYDLEEIPTTFALDLPDLPEETLPTGMLSLAGNIVNESYNYYNSLGLSGVLISVGVIVCVIRLLRGR